MREPSRLVDDSDLALAILALEDVIQIHKVVRKIDDASYKRALSNLKKARKRDLQWGDV